MPKKRAKSCHKKYLDPYANLLPGESVLDKFRKPLNLGWPGIPDPDSRQARHWPRGTPQARINMAEDYNRRFDRTLREDSFGLRALGYPDTTMRAIYFAPPDVQQAMLTKLGITPKSQQSGSQGGQQGAQGQDPLLQRLQALQLGGAGGMGNMSGRQGRNAQLLADLAVLQQGAGQGLQQRLQGLQLRGGGRAGIQRQQQGTGANVLAALAGGRQGGRR